MMDLSISIVSWNTKQLLDECLKSVFETIHGIEFEVIVVDNNSSDGSAQMVREKYPQVRLIENTENVGFAKANNQAYAVSVGRYFLLLNSDTVCLLHAINHLVSFVDCNPHAGAIGPILLYPGERFQYSWARFPTLWDEIRGKLRHDIEGIIKVPMTLEVARALPPFRTDWVKGCCLLMRRKTIEEIGCLDDSIFLYSEETDWCLRCRRAGWDIWINPRAEIIHLGGQSVKQLSLEWLNHLRRGKVYYFKKHHGLMVAAILNIALRLRYVLGSYLK